MFIFLGCSWILSCPDRGQIHIMLFTGLFSSLHCYLSLVSGPRGFCWCQHCSIVSSVNPFLFSPLCNQQLISASCIPSPILDTKDIKMHGTLPHAENTQCCCGPSESSSSAWKCRLEQPGYWYPGPLQFLQISARPHKYFIRCVLFTSSNSTLQRHYWMAFHGEI